MQIPWYHKPVLLYFMTVREEGAYLNSDQRTITFHSASECALQVQFLFFDIAAGDNFCGYTMHVQTACGLIGVFTLSFPFTTATTTGSLLHSGFIRMQVIAVWDGWHKSCPRSTQRGNYQVVRLNFVVEILTSFCKAVESVTMAVEYIPSTPDIIWGLPGITLFRSRCSGM